MCILIEFNHLNLQDMREDNLLELDRVEIFKMNPIVQIIYIQEELNRTDIRMKLQIDGNLHQEFNKELIPMSQHNQVGQNHLQGFNKEQIHLLRHNQREVEYKIGKIKTFLVFLRIFPSILTKNLLQQ